MPCAHVAFVQFGQVEPGGEMLAVAMQQHRADVVRQRAEEGLEAEHGSSSSALRFSARLSRSRRDVAPPLGGERGRQRRYQSGIVVVLGHSQLSPLSCPAARRGIQSNADLGYPARPWLPDHPRSRTMTVQITSADCAPASAMQPASVARTIYVRWASRHSAAAATAVPRRRCYEVRRLGYRRRLAPRRMICQSAPPAGCGRVRLAAPDLMRRRRRCPESDGRSP